MTPRRHHRLRPHVRRRVGARTAFADAVARARLALDAARPGARRRRAHPPARAPRRTVRRVLRPRDGPGDRSSGGGAVHLGHRGRQLPSRGARGAPRAGAADRVHRRPAARAARRRRRPDRRPAEALRRRRALVLRGRRCPRTPAAGPARCRRGGRSRPGRWPRPRAARRARCTSTCRSASRSCRPASRWSTRRAGPTGGRGPCRPSPRARAPDRGDDRARSPTWCAGPAAGRSWRVGAPGVDPATADRFAADRGVAGARRPALGPARRAHAISTYDALLRVPGVRRGPRARSRDAGRRARSRARPRRAWLGPDGRAGARRSRRRLARSARTRPERRIAADAEALLAAVAARLEADHHDPGGGWIGSWASAESAARTAIDALVDGWPEPFEGRIARDLVAALPDGATLVVASSMPVRDVESFAAERDGVRFTPTAASTASTASCRPCSASPRARDDGAGPVVALLGDLCFLHDSNGLLGVGRPRRSTRRSSWSTTTAAASSRSCPRPTPRPTTSRRCSARPTASTSPRSPRVHGVAVDEVEKAARPGARGRCRRARRRRAGGARPHRPRHQRHPPPRGLVRRRRRPRPDALTRSVAWHVEPPHAAQRAKNGGAGLGADEGAEHGLELGLGLGPLGVGVGAGDDAGAGPQHRGAPSSSAPRRATAHSPSPRASTQPTGPA